MATPQSVSFHTLGCKLNFSESSRIRRAFVKQGYSVVDMKDGSDIFILNTCSVTEFADRKCRKIIRSVLRTNPDTKVVVIGCYAQLKPQEIAEIPGVDLVLGAAEKFNVLNFIDGLSKSPGKGLVSAGDVAGINQFESSFSFGDRTRTFLKIQDGCDYNCSFCTIPLARGQSRSPSIEDVVNQAREIAKLGIREIVLTGVNIGDFGKMQKSYSSILKDEQDFLHLIHALDEVEGIERFRISSIEPNLCSDQIIEFVSNSCKFVPHFHMPLQSGSDKILGLMRRRYRSSLYADRVQKIKDLLPHACIGADVIVGFPGELVRDFEDTRDFVSYLDISYLHVFTYSERDDTPAIRMPNPVPMHIRRKRNNELRVLSKAKERKFYADHLDSIRPVLFESSKNPSVLTGYTDNYIKVYAPADRKLINTIKNVKLEKIHSSGSVAISIQENLFNLSPSIGYI